MVTDNFIVVNGCSQLRVTVRWLISRPVVWVLVEHDYIMSLGSINQHDVGCYLGAESIGVATYLSCVEKWPE